VEKLFERVLRESDEMMELGEEVKGYGV